MTSSEKLWRESMSFQCERNKFRFPIVPERKTDKIFHKTPSDICHKTSNCQTFSEVLSRFAFSFHCIELLGFRVESSGVLMFSKFFSVVQQIILISIGFKYRIIQIIVGKTESFR